MNVNLQRIGSFGTLAVGLGLGAAMAWTPGVASADVATEAAAASPDAFGFADALSADAAAASADFSGFTEALSAASTLPTFAFDPQDLSISFSGINLFTDGTAHATSGVLDFAIADGAGATATAGFNTTTGVTTGTFDFASAEGADSVATANGTATDIATAVGTSAHAIVNLGTLDFADAFGDSSSATAGGVAANTGDVALALGDAAKALAGDLAAQTINGVSVNVGNFDIAGALADGATATSQAGPYDFVFEPGLGLSTLDLPNLADLTNPIFSTIGTDVTTILEPAIANLTGSGGDVIADLLALI